MPDCWGAFNVGVSQLQHYNEKILSCENPDWKEVCLLRIIIHTSTRASWCLKIHKSGLHLQLFDCFR